jgi:hypothetical protein
MKKGSSMLAIIIGRVAITGRNVVFPEIALNPACAFSLLN